MIVTYAAQTLMWSVTALAGGFAWTWTVLWASGKGRNGEH